MTAKATADKNTSFGGIVQRKLHGSSVNLFYVPAIVLSIIFVIYPLISGFHISLTNWDGYSPTRNFVGMQNYVTMFKDANFWLVLRNTFIFAIGSTFFQQVLGLGLALLLNTRIRGRNFMRAVIYLPVLVSAIIMGKMYYFVFHYQQGALNTVLAALGLQHIAWFQNANIAVAIIVAVNSLQFVGTSMIIYLAGLQSIDESVIEAASLDGASGWKLFWDITLPSLMPAFSTSVILNLIGGLKLYDVIVSLTGGGPGMATNSVSTYISIIYFSNQNAGYASAIGFVLFIIIAVVTVVAQKLLNSLGWEN